MVSPRKPKRVTVRWTRNTVESSVTNAIVAPSATPNRTPARTPYNPTRFRGERANGTRNVAANASTATPLSVGAFVTDCLSRSRFVSPLLVSR